MQLLRTTIFFIIAFPLCLPSAFAKSTKYHKEYKYAKEEMKPPQPKFWGGIEYMNMWENNGPLNVPLVTQNSNPLAVGAIDETGTNIIYGEGSGKGLNYGNMSGGRLTLGTWLDDDQFFGIEFSGFLLAKKFTNFDASSAGGDFPVIAVPYYSTQPTPGETAVSGNSLFSTNNPTDISVNTSSQLWGAELNWIYNLAAGSRFPVQALAGFRYFSLNETLSLKENIYDTLSDEPTNGIVTFKDNFQTQNNFYGVQFGLRSKLIAKNGLTLDLVAKVALGENAEVIDISGNTTMTNDALGVGTGTLNSGIFAQPSNIGRFSQNTFAFLPEAQVKIGYMIAPNVHPYIGYDVMYLNKAVRPGEQIDRNINSTESVALSGATSITGALDPGKPTFSNTKYWIQGVTAGVEMMF